MVWEFNERIKIAFEVPDQVHVFGKAEVPSKGEKRAGNVPSCGLGVKFVFDGFHWFILSQVTVFWQSVELLGFMIGTKKARSPRTSDRAFAGC